MIENGFGIVTPAALAPISLHEAKAHLRVEHDDENALITGLIKAATARAEEYTRRALVTQTQLLTLDRFPDAGQAIVLPRGPVSSVSAIAYVDENQESQAFTDFVLDASKLLPRVMLAYGHAWPGTLSRSAVVTVDYVAGYGTPADVPDAIKLAINIMVATWYDDVRSNVQIGDQPYMMPEGSKAILGPYRGQCGVY